MFRVTVNGIQRPVELNNITSLSLRDTYKFILLITLSWWNAILCWGSHS